MQALLLFVAVASDAAAFYGARTPRMAAMVAVGNKGGFMEPLTTIELGTCTWLELATLFCAIEAELWTHPHNADEHSTSFVNREKVRRALSHRTFRSR